MPILTSKMVKIGYSQFWPFLAVNQKIGFAWPISWQKWAKFAKNQLCWFLANLAHFCQEIGQAKPILLIGRGNPPAGFPLVATGKSRFSRIWKASQILPDLARICAPGVSPGQILVKSGQILPKSGSLSQATVQNSQNLLADSGYFGL